MQYKSQSPSAVYRGAVSSVEYQENRYIYLGFQGGLLTK